MIRNIDTIKLGNDTMTSKLLRLTSVMDLTGLSRSSIYLRISNGSFPRPVDLGGGRAVGFIQAEIDGWIDSRIVQRNGEDSAARTARCSAEVHRRATGQRRASGRRAKLKTLKQKLKHDGKNPKDCPSCMEHARQYAGRLHTQTIWDYISQYRLQYLRRHNKGLREEAL